MVFQKTPDLILYKIADFGICKNLQIQSTRSAFKVMTLEYAAPEQINEEEATLKFDSWPLGIIIYKICSGNVHPYKIKGIKNDKLFDYIMAHEVEYHVDHFSELSVAHKEFKTIIMNLLEKDPEKRWSVEQVLRHPLMREPCMQLIDKLNDHPEERKKIQMLMKPLQPSSK